MWIEAAGNAISCIITFLKFATVSLEKEEFESPVFLLIVISSLFLSALGAGVVKDNIEYQQKCLIELDGKININFIPAPLRAGLLEGTSTNMSAGVGVAPGITTVALSSVPGRANRG